MPEVVGFALVKDEADVIERTVEHMLRQVDHVVVVDNGSTDGTVEILEGLPVELRHDADPAHHQARKMTAIAKSTTGQFVVPFDADELWYAPGEWTIADAIQRWRDTWIFTAELFEHPPIAGMKGHPFDAMRWRLPASPLMKVAGRRHESMEFTEGCHSLSYNGEYPGTRKWVLEVRHYPYRSPEQFIRKVRNCYAGRKLTQPEPGQSVHIMEWGRLLEEQGEGALEQYYYEHIERLPGTQEIWEDPCPV